MLESRRRFPMISQTLSFRQGSGGVI